MPRVSKNAPLQSLQSQSLQSQPLQGKIALVAGATRGAGRGIAIALGEAGATVYCTGRSSRCNSKKNPQKRSLRPGQRETIEETADLVTAAGGHGIAVRVDHEVPAEVKKLTALIKRRHKGLDILVNDVWGGDALTEWSKPFWTVNLENGLRMLRQAIHSHIITAHYAAPLMLGRLKKKIDPAESSSKSPMATLSTTAAISFMTS